MEIIEQSSTIDEILNAHHLDLGKDHLGYSGHCYRLLNYVRLMEISEEDMLLLEVTIAYHDLGIWTNKTMDYLEPSWQLAKAYVEKHQLDIDLNHLELIIKGHHKLGVISNSPLAEHLRKADQIDLSFGTISHGIDKVGAKQIRAMFPNHGFQMKVLRKVTAYAFCHPLKPFPMLNG